MGVQQWWGIPGVQHRRQGLGSASSGGSGAWSPGGGRWGHRHPPLSSKLSVTVQASVGNSRPGSDELSSLPLLAAAEEPGSWWV